jgi:hypothetical protein
MPDVATWLDNLRVFGVLLIALGVVGLILDDRGQLPEQGYAWVPGAAIASLVIGVLLLLGRLGRNGTRGVGGGLAGCGAAVLLTDRWFGWAPDNLDAALTVGAWVAVVLGALVWLGGMATEHGAGGLGIGLGILAVASLVGDTAFDQPAPWDAALNVVTAACVCGALCAGLAGFGSAIEERDLLGTAYTWLTSAVVGPLGLSVTAIVAAAAFDEPAWVFALLVIVVALGALGAAAAMFLGVRELSQNRQTFAEYEKLVAAERAQRRLGVDVDIDEDELAGLWGDDDRSEPADATTAGGAARSGRPRSRVDAAGPAGPGDRSAGEPGPASASAPGQAARPRGWRTVPAVLSLVADTTAIVTVLVAAVNLLRR